MKLLHVITSMRTGGAERLVASMLPRFRREGVECSLALLDATPTPLLEAVERGGIEVFRLGKGLRSVYNPLHIGRLTRLMAEGEFDIVHTHNTTPQFFAALAERPASTRLVTTEHNTSNRRVSIPGFRRLDLAMYRAYDAVVCCGDAVRTALLQHLPELASHPCIEVIANGIDLEPYFRLDTPATPLGSVEILMVSAFRPQKDHATALRALALLPERFRLSFAGEGELFDKTKEMASRLGLNGRVRFLGNRADIPELYAASHIALLSTRYEGLSLGCIEAMASGRPFVASDVTGVREVAAGAAFLVPGTDPRALADTLVRVADSYPEALATAAAARSEASRFDIQSTVKQYLKLYNNLYSAI